MQDDCRPGNGAVEGIEVIFRRFHVGIATASPGHILFVLFLICPVLGRNLS